MSEDDIREAVVSLLKTKDLLFHSFDSLTSNDFEFVKCVNRHIYIPDGIVAFDGNSILSLYRSGSAIYVRLTRSFAKVIHHKCNFMYNYILSFFAQSLASHSEEPIYSTPITTTVTLHVSPSIYAPTNALASTFSDVTITFNYFSCFYISFSDYRCICSSCTH